MDLFDRNNTFQDYFLQSKARPGLINQNRLTQTFGANFYEFLPSPSSGEESEIEQEQILNLPTVQEVVETMTDENTIKKVVITI